MYNTRRWTRVPTLLLCALAAGACDGLDAVGIGSPDDLDPELVDAVAVWIDEGWGSTAPHAPLGQPAVELVWELPEEWDGEAFRVYSREIDRSSYFLIATVTSCGESQCRYTDLNVVAGESYDYYVASVDERDGRELGASEAWRVDVPEFEEPAAPGQPEAIALDGAVFLRWPSTGAERYRVFLERIGSDSVFFEIGATDGAAYLDARAENGTRYGYRVAAVDTLGRVSARSALVLAVPRPDYHAELLYPSADDAQASGFRFVASEEENPVVAWNAADAHWHLEAVGGELRIVPRGDTRVTQGAFTTALTCGPEDEADCESVDVAPAASAFGSAAVPVSAGNTYVFRVVGADGQVRYGKVRAQGQATDESGRRVVVLDWAYQTLAGEPSLRLVAAR